MTLHRSLKAVLFFAVCVFAVVFLCAPVFADTAEIKITGEHDYKAVELTPQIYNKANQNLYDLLIKDETGENVAYFIIGRHSDTRTTDSNTYIPEFETEEIDGYTIIKIYGLKHVAINNMTFETDDTFERRFYFGNSLSKVLYNLPFGEAMKDTTVRFAGFSSPGEILEVKIKNGDDAPINISGITCTYFADEVVFKGENGKTYSLFFGDSSVSASPVYDIVNYKDLIIAQGYDVLNFGNITVDEEMGGEVTDETESETETESGLETEAETEAGTETEFETEAEGNEEFYSVLFNVFIIIVSVLLLVIIMMRMRKT
ncbi:MAG: hypothetical protein LBS21_00855 [Clostridiales bacterium]|nr:hypothetical protein [Clostridiales bacterium]